MDREERLERTRKAAVEAVRIASANFKGDAESLISEAIKISNKALRKVFSDHIYCHWFSFAEDGMEMDVNERIRTLVLSR